MAGGCTKPYRMPCCYTAWPTIRALTPCTQHKRDNENGITEKCNTEIHGTTKTYFLEGDCDTGETWVNGNCYKTCVPGNAENLLLDGSTYLVGTTIFTLGGGCGSINEWDKIRFAGDPNIYTISTTVATVCPASLAGFPLQIKEGLAIKITAGVAITVIDGGLRDFSECHKQGWKAVRAQTLWHGRVGFESACDECKQPATHYLIRYGTVTHVHTEDPDNDADYTNTRTREIVCDATTGLLSLGECSNTGVAMDAIGIKLLYGDWSCGPQFSTSTPGDLGSLLNTMFDNALNGTGTQCSDCVSAAAAGEDCYIGPVTGGITTYYCAQLLTHSDTEITGRLSITNDSDPFYSDVYDFTWTLSDAYSLAAVIADAYVLADLWDMSDDVLYPWRYVDYLRITDEDTGVSYHRSIPFVKRRQIGVQTLSLPTDDDCTAIPDCGGEAYSPCPYDGEIIGQPLPYYEDPGTHEISKRAYNYHYGFYAEDSGVAARGWTPSETGLPTNSTWWTKPYEPFAVDNNVECDMSIYPRGGWIRIEPGGSVVTVQKWVQTRETVPSANLFRPCGADRLTEDQADPDFCAKSEGCPGAPRRLLWDGRDAAHPLPWAICGRAEIASFTWSGGVTSFVLAEDSYLESGDFVDFVYYIGVDFTESVEDGPSDAGYEATVTDATHFTVVMTEETYNAMQAIVTAGTTYYVKSHGAPHFKWNDDKRKGDFVWCIAEYNFCTSSETITCETDCTNLMPCNPQVMAILGPNPVELEAGHQWEGPPSNVAVKSLPESPEHGYNNGVRYVIMPYAEQQDPLWQSPHTPECDGCEDGEIPACPDPPPPECIPPMIERRCEVPDGAPAFVAGGGYSSCGGAPVHRPAAKPKGLTGLGDAVAVVAQPIARAIDKVTSKLPAKMRTNMAGCGGCKKRQAALNKAVPFKPKV